MAPAALGTTTGERVLWRLAMARCGGRAAHDPAAGELLERASGEPAVLGALLERAARDRVLVPVVDRLAGEFAPGRAHHEEFARRVELRIALERLQDEAAAAFARSGVVVRFWKGFSLDGYFPAGYRREFRDLDAFVGDLGTLWRASVPLLQADFRPAALALRPPPAGGAWWGGLVLLRQAEARAGGWLKVELVAGGLRLHWHTGLRLRPELWSARAGGQPALPRWRALVLHLAELLEHDILMLRDAVDVAVLATGLDRAGVDACRAAVARLGLGEEVARVRRAVLRLEGDGAPARRLAALLPGWRRAAPPLPEPLRLAAGHTVPHLARRAPLSVPRAVARGAVRDALTVMQRRGSRVARSRPARWLGRPDRLLAAGSWVQLLPLSPEPRGPLRARLDGGAMLVRTPIGTFVATGPVPPDPAEVLALRERGAPSEAA